jgi:hypothetical protein
MSGRPHGIRQQDWQAMKQFEHSKKVSSSPGEERMAGTEQRDLFQFSLDQSATLDRLITDILMGREGPWPVSDKQRAFLHLITWHKGASHALPLASIADKLKMPAREVKAMVKELVEQFALPIGASRQEPYGYFLCVTAEDVELAIRPLESEVISLARRIRALGGEKRLAEFAGQLQLQLDKKGAA